MVVTEKYRFKGENFSHTEAETVYWQVWWGQEWHSKEGSFWYRTETGEWQHQFPWGRGGRCSIWCTSRGTGLARNTDSLNGYHSGGRVCGDGCNIWNITTTIFLVNWEGRGLFRRTGERILKTGREGKVTVTQQSRRVHDLGVWAELRLAVINESDNCGHLNVSPLQVQVPKAMHSVDWEFNFLNLAFNLRRRIKEKTKSWMRIKGVTVWWTWLKYV